MSPVVNNIFIPSLRVIWCYLCVITIMVQLCSWRGRKRSEVRVQPVEWAWKQVSYRLADAAGSQTYSFQSVYSHEDRETQAGYHNKMIWSDTRAKMLLSSSLLHTHTCLCVQSDTSVVVCLLVIVVVQFITFHWLTCWLIRFSFKEKHVCDHCAYVIMYIWI